jgi:hypothetical protein
MHINQTSLVIMLVMVQQVQMVQIIGPYAGQGSTFNNSNFFGNQLVIKHQMLLSNFLGRQAGYSATSAGGSNFLGRQAGYSNVLITQIFR